MRTTAPPPPRSTIDGIREQIDGVAVPALVLTLTGASANDFFQPYQPAPGTLLA